MKQSVVAVMLLLLLACHTGPMSALKLLDPGTHVISLCDHAASCDDTLSLKFLGVSGFIIRTRNGSLMTAPSFTHPSLTHVLFALPVHSDTALADAAFANGEADDIRAILVGHSHYDHLMDVPYIARRKAPTALVVGTPSMKHVLAGDHELDTARVVALPIETAATAWRAGRWFYVTARWGPSRFRVMPIASTHAPNFAGVTIANWEERTDRRELPRNAWQWPKGEVYAYVIDVIRPDSSPAFRIFYQDAASDSLHSIFPPLEGRDKRRVDVAILCAGNFADTKRYPDVALESAVPRYAIVAHWEDFFRRQSEDLAVLITTDTRKLAARMDGRPAMAWATLRPYSSINFLYSDSAR